MKEDNTLIDFNLRDHLKTILSKWPAAIMPTEDTINYAECIIHNSRLSNNLILVHQTSNTKNDSQKLYTSDLNIYSTWAFILIQNDYWVARSIWRIPEMKLLYASPGEIT